MLCHVFYQRTGSFFAEGFEASLIAELEDREAYENVKLISEQSDLMG